MGAFTVVEGEVVITDRSGNPVGVVVDGTYYRLRVEMRPHAEFATRKGIATGSIVLATTTVSPIRSTTYTEQASNAQRSFVSSSASDAAAGTGARTVRVTYYTATMSGPFTETVTLNGTSAVNTVATNICFIEKIEVLTAGSTGAAVGVVSLKAATAGGGATIWSVAAATTSTDGAHHYVATGVIAYVTGISGAIKGADASGFVLRSKNPLNATDAELQIADLLRCPSASGASRVFGTPIVVAGPARITAFAVPDSTSSRTYYGSFDFYEE